MFPRQISFALLASAALCAEAEAQTFVTELRLPQREAVRETFAERRGDVISVDRSVLVAIGIAPPPGEGALVSLSAVPGLTYVELQQSAAIVLTCTAACFDEQRLRVGPAAPQVDASPWGAYANYDATASWVRGADANLGGFVETNLFGPMGRGEASWFGLTGAGLTRLETRWTIDQPRRQLRWRVGDSSVSGVAGGFARFAGIQVGRNFALTPHTPTHPTPLLRGKAEAASTVELYVDGVLQARERVAAGPFAFEQPPLVTGAGEAQIVVTDVLGRQQVLTRPFFVSRDLLRAGLTDWSLAIGAEREGYGVDSFSYGRGVATGRYRAGLSNALTADAAIDFFENGGAAELGATFLAQSLGQFRVSGAQSSRGRAFEAAWFRDGRSWSAGVQVSQRDRGFRALGRATGALRTTAANLNFELGRYGAASFTAAAVTHNEGAPTRALAATFTPNVLQHGALAFRLGYSQRERAELTLGMNFTLGFNGGASSAYGVDFDRRGATYRVGAQRPAAPDGGAGWRMRSVGGAQERLELGGAWRGRRGDAGLLVSAAPDSFGVRAEHAGSIGRVANYGFVSRRIEGAFAIVDVGVRGVGVSRDHLRVGVSNDNGRVMAVNLRPYEQNIIAIASDDLPLDRAPSHLTIGVAPREGAGVVVRFEEATQAISEWRVRSADGAAPQRGTVLVRARDGARFPIGSAGRLVVSDAQVGDVLELQGDRRCAAIVGAQSRRELSLVCAGGA